MRLRSPQTGDPEKLGAIFVLGLLLFCYEALLTGLVEPRETQYDAIGLAGTGAAPNSLSERDLHPTPGRFSRRPSCKHTPRDPVRPHSPLTTH